MTEIFFARPQYMEKVDSFNFVGLVLDTHLKWNFHVRKVANKLTQINWILRKLKHIFPQRILKTIYSSLIESRVNYCLVLWGTNFDRIFKIKKKAVQIISLVHYKSHTSHLFKSLGILNIKDMYIVANIMRHTCMQYKLVYFIYECCINNKCCVLSCFI